MKLGKTDRLWDVCAGTAAVALRAAANGMPARNITLVEKGPWGMFWKVLLSDAFDPKRLERWLKQIPADPTAVSGFLRDLYSKQCSVEDAPYVFFILASGSFQGSAFDYSVTDGVVTWKGSYSCGNYFLPSATSVRRYPTKVMPEPEELGRRILNARQLLNGVTIHHADLCSLPPPTAAHTIVYADPPYPNTKGYNTATAAEFPRIEEWLRRCKCPVYISGYERTKAAQTWQVGTARLGGSNSNPRPELLMLL